MHVGWRVFEQRCASCHGHNATGGAQAPDLLPPLRTMGPRQFVDKVLRRYDWDLPAAPTSATATANADALDALIDQILQRQQGALTMPAWQGDPQVNAHILDLYAYLSARAEGSQGPGRPAPK
jgi:mono/diheme cytochrome c family protein